MWGGPFVDTGASAQYAPAGGADTDGGARELWTGAPFASPERWRSCRVWPDLLVPTQETGRFRFAWWNTSFNRSRPKGNGTGPKATKAIADHKERTELAENVIRELLQTADCVALGEVEADEHLGLEQALGGAALSWYRDDSRGLSLAINTSVATLVSDLRHRTREGTRNFHTAWQASLWLIHAPAQLDLYVVHWPSDVGAPAGAHRRTLGQNLRHIVADCPAPPSGTRGHQIVLGDFNEEPFDEGLAQGLLAGRDRYRVRSADPPGAFLYNPCWRMLGEQRPWPTTAPIAPAGSAYHPGSGSSRWRTIDQVVLSGGLLGDDGWVLDEKALQYVEHKDIFDPAAGTLVNRFDHLPLIGSLVHLKQGP